MLNRSLSFLSLFSHETIIALLFYISGLFFSVFFIIIYLDRTDTVMLYALFSFFAYTLIMIVSHMRYRSITLWSTRLFLVVGTLIIEIAISRNISHIEGLLLLFFIPMAAFLLLSIKESVVWVLAFIISVIIMLVSPYNVVPYTTVEIVSVFLTISSGTMVLGLIIIRMRQIQSELLKLSQDQEKSKRALESIIGTELVSYALYDEKGFFTYMSNRTMAFLGTKKSQVLGHHYSEVFKDDEALIKELDEVFYSDTRIFTAPLKDKVFDFRFQRLVDEKSVTSVFSQVAFDVSEKVNARLELKQNEYYLENLLETTFEALILTLDAVIVKANLKAAELFGYEKSEDVLDRHLSDFVTSSSMQEIALHIKNDDCDPYEIKGIKKDGTTVLIEVKGRNIKLFGKNYRVSAIQSLESIQEARSEIAKLAKAVEQSASMIMITNKEGAIEYVNKRFETVTGYRLSDLLGKTPSVYSSRHHNQEFYADLWNAILQKKSWTHEIHNMKQNGEIYISKNIISAITDDEGEITHFISVQEDITQQKNQEKRMFLQSKQADRGELLSMIAHQWRQPLATISTIGAKIQFGLELENISTEELKEDIICIDKEVQSLSQTINDFSTFFAPEHTLHTSTISVLISRTLTILEEHLHALNIDVVVDLEEDIEITTYLNEFVQVLFNIVKNSIEQIELRKSQDKRILFTVTQDDEEIIIDIEDFAGGIADDVIDNIFLPYFSTKSAKHGVGLGLYMCHTIVENHCHGKIYVNNRENGTIFTLTLPKEFAVLNPNIID